MRCWLESHGHSMARPKASELAGSLRWNQPDFAREVTPVAIGWNVSVTMTEQ